VAQRDENKGKWREGREGWESPCRGTSEERRHGVRSSKYVYCGSKNLNFSQSLEFYYCIKFVYFALLQYFPYTNVWVCEKLWNGVNWLSGTRTQRFSTAWSWASFIHIHFSKCSFPRFISILFSRLLLAAYISQEVFRPKFCMKSFSLPLHCSLVSVTIPTIKVGLYKPHSSRYGTSQVAPFISLSVWGYRIRMWCH
jgi:hypothetical protein